MSRVFEFDLGYDPLFKGTLDEFVTNFESFELGDEVAKGVRLLFCYLDIEKEDIRHYYVADNDETFYTYAKQINAEFYDPIEPEEQ